MKKYLIILSAAFLIAATFHVTRAEAASPTLRLDLDTTLFSFNRTALERNGDKDFYNSFGFGQFNGYGPGTGYAPGFGFGVGILPIDNLTVGGKFGVSGGQIQMRSLGTEDDIFNNEGEYTGNFFSYRVLPFVEYKFDLGTVQPFIMATIGYRGGVQWNEDNDDLKMHNHIFSYGGGGGVHFFVADAVSIDTGIEAMGGAGKTKLEYDDGDNSVSVKSDLRDFNISAKVGMSGWF